MSKVHVLHARVQHVRDGKVIFEEQVDNILHDEGEQAILSAYFATGLAGFGAPPASLYLGLDNRTTLAEANTLTNLSGEPVGTGYARKALSTAGTGVSGQDFYINQPATYYQADSKIVTFQNTGATAWTAVKNLFLCTVLSGTAGKLICSLALSAERILRPQDSLNASLYIGLSE